MSQRNFLSTLVALLMAACIQSGPGPAAPAITAQGFDISEPRETTPGNLGDTRLRLEVPGKIESIWVTQGTFRSDLAKTLDRDVFRLFGIEQRPYSRVDVTIDMKNYVNEKLSSVGVYQIDIRVVDQRGKSTSDRVFIDIRSAGEAPTVALPVVVEPSASTGEFVLQRVGPGSVSGAEPFGITWKTIDPISVTVQVAALGATKIAEIAAVDFEQVRTRADLAEIVDQCTAADVIEFDTANAAAAGQALAIMKKDERFLLKVSASETFLTDAGTTVVISGRYKH